MPSDPPVGGVVLTKITLEDEYQWSSLAGPRPAGRHSGPGKLLGQACPPQARAWVGGVPLGQL
jgi:hypothetical protein